MTEPLRDLPRWFQIYTLIEVLAYAAAATWALSSAHLEVVLVLILLFAATALIKPVQNPMGGITDPNIGLIIIATLLWPPQEVLLGVGIGSFGGLILFRRNEVWRAATNGAGWGLPAAAAGIIAHGMIAYMAQALATLTIAGVLAVATYRVVNTGIFAIFRSLRFRHSFIGDWLQSVVDNWPSQLLCAPLAIVLAAIAERTQTVESRLALTAAYIVALPIARLEYGYYIRSQQMLDEIVEAMVRALEGVYRVAREHGDRVRVMAVETGRRLTMSGRSLTALRLACRLHDVGLLAGQEEGASEGPRAVAGGRILARFPDPLVANYVSAQAERWDGKGLPKQVAGKAIPLGARILSACEVYDSAVSGLPPFEEALSSESARSHLISLCGTMLDPTVVMMLLQVTSQTKSENGKK
jgi:hypothetical protein